MKLDDTDTTKVENLFLNNNFPASAMIIEPNMFDYSSL